MDERAELEARRALKAKQSPSGAMDFATGFNRGLAQFGDIFGNPLAVGFNALGIPVPSNPIQSSFGQMGLLSPENGFLGRVGQEVGASLPMAAATLGTGAIASPLGYVGRELASAVGGGIGAGIAQKVAPDNAVAELAGQVVGGAIPSLAGPVLKSAMSSPDAAANLQAFESAQVSPTAGQVTGNTGTQTVEGMLRGAPGSGGVMTDFARGQADELGNRVDDIATRLGGTTDEVAGRMVEKGLRGFVTEKQRVASSLWDRLDNFIPGDAPVGMGSTKGALESLSGESKLAQAFASPTIKKAMDATEGVEAVPYSELRKLRSIIGEKLSNPDLIADVSRSELKRLYGAITDDIKAAAAQAGGLDAFERANRYTRSLHGRVDDVVEPLLRRTTPEKLFSAVRNNDASSLRKLGRTLDEKSWKVVAGSVIRDLGAARPGAQNAAGDVFSPETFLTEWNKLGPEVRKELFTRLGPRYVQDLDSVAKVAELVRGNSRVLANPSGTTPLGMNIAASTIGGSALVSGNVGTAATIFGAMAAANGSARLFTSPRFVKWLASASRAPVEQLPNLTSRLLETMSDESEDLRGAAEELVGNL